MGELINANNNEVSNNLDDLLTCVKNEILSYCPYVDDRSDLYANAKVPTFGIRFTIVNDITNIYYMVRVPKLEHDAITKVNVQAPDYAQMDHVITFEELSGIIDFILEDHSLFEKFSYRTYPGTRFPYQIHMDFNIDWPDSEGPKIYCGDMNIELDFQDPKYLKDFLKQIMDKYNNRVYTLALNNTIAHRNDISKNDK